jgi:hypothetical protein
MIDAEVEAIASLNRQMHRLTATIVLLLTPLGVALAIAVYLGLYDLADLREPKICVAAAAIVGLAFLQRSARLLRRVLLRARTPGWVAELAARWRVEPVRLEEVASLWKLD